MNKDHIERTKRMIEVMQAYVDGEEIHTEDGYMPNPLWDWARCEYRIAKTPDSIDWGHVAPEFKYLVRGSDGRAFLFTHMPSPLQYIWGTFKCIRPIEAIIFSSYKRGNVDWKDSLVIRPGCE